MATVRIEKHKRGFLGHIFKWLFILFNTIMLIWLVSYWTQVAHLSTDATSDAEKAGAAIGTTMGTGLLLMFWMVGTVVLGALTYFSRGPKIITEVER